LTPEQAQFALTIIAACGVIAWMAALWGYGRMVAPRPGEAEELDPSSGDRRLVATWSRIVTGAPEDVAEALLRVLTPVGSGLVRVERGADGSIVLRGSSRLRFPSVPAFSRCEIRVAAAGAGSEVSFRADYGLIRRRARALALVLLALGAVVMVGLVGFLWMKVLPSGKPPVRVQVLQAVQMIHFLWPPWLVYAMERYARRGTEAYLDAAASNASVLAEALAAKRRKAGGG
jgi:hypothetical protein